MKLYDEFKDRRPEFEILAFHDASAKSLEELDGKLAKVKQEVWGGRDLPFPVLMDSTGDTIRRFGINSFPTVIVIDPEGKVVKQGSEGTVRMHLMETSKQVKAHTRKLEASRTQKKFEAAVKAVAKAGGKYPAFALSTFAQKQANQPWQVTAIRNALEQLGGEWAVGFFLGEHGLKAKQKKTRIAAAEVLGKIGDSNLLYHLSRMAKEEQDEKVKKALHAAMKRLSPVPDR